MFGMFGKSKYLKKVYQDINFFITNTKVFNHFTKEIYQKVKKKERIENNRIIENDGRVLLVHPVVLPFGSEKTLSYNIRMFDYLASKAIANAIASKSKKTRSSWNSL